MFRKSYTVCSQSNLSWSHYKYLLKFDNENERNYYINRCIQNNLSVRGLINIDSKEKISEKVLKKYILKELEHFFLELGTGFTFVGSEYKLSYDNKNYYVDLLLFNYKLIRYIVCELKLGEIKRGDIAQTKVYMMLTDKFLKRRFHNETIGIIITRKNGKLALEYVSDPNIFVTTYKLNGKIKMVNT